MPSAFLKAMASAIVPGIKSLRSQRTAFAQLATRWETRARLAEARLASSDKALAEAMARDAASGVSWTAANLGAFKPAFAAPSLSVEEQGIADRFHDLYYSKLDSGRGLHTIVLSWMGYEMFKCPLDLWTYQELIVLRKPDVIIETGTYKGGSALYLASVCDGIDHGRIVSIDIDGIHMAIRPKHPRITYLEGSSTAPEIFEKVTDMVAGRTNVMVILDSDHRRDHVLAELRLYADLVPVGGVLVVEDTNINGHPTYPEFGPGPWEAVDTFLSEDSRFVVDHAYERFILTMNPRGYLRRVS